MLKQFATTSISSQYFANSKVFESGMRNPKNALLISNAFVILAVVLAFSLWGKRSYELEEFGGLNASHQVAFHNQVNFPIYDEWEVMIAHPPVNGLILGLVRKVFPLYYALAIIPFFLISLFLWLVLKLQTSEIQKSAFLLGLFALFVACLYSIVNFSVRPDLNITLLWLCGIMTLENGRLRNWKGSYIFFGAALFTLASILHYPYMPGILGVGVYYYLSFREQERKFFFKTASTLTLGGFLIGIPFLAFFIIPNFFSILSTVRVPLVVDGYETPTGLWSTLKYHLAFHRMYYPNLQSGSLFLAWLHKLPVPIGVFSCLGLMLIRKTRVFGFAALPLVFVLTFIIKQKKDYYLIPEWALFFIFLGTVAGLILGSDRFRKIPGNSSGIFVLHFTNLMVLLLTLTNFSVFGFSTNKRDKQYYIGDVIRAASMKVTGPEAVIGGMHAGWYVSGAKYWFNEDKALFQYPEMVDEHLKQVNWFSDYAFGKNVDFYSFGSAKLTLSGLYAKKLLRLGAVIYNDNPTFVLYTVPNNPAYKGSVFYFPSRDSIIEYTPDDAGTHIIASFSCLNRRDFPDLDRLNIPFMSFVTWPSSSYSAKPSDQPDLMVYLVMDTGSIAKITELLAPDCLLFESFASNARVYSHANFMESCSYFDENLTCFPEMNLALEAKKSRTEM